MGNCTPKGVFHDVTAKGLDVIRLMTDSGHILKFKAPKMVNEVLRDFPGYKICAKGRFSMPFSDQDELAGGQMYYLLPVERGGARGVQPPELPNKSLSSEKREEAAARKSSAAAVEMVAGLVNGTTVEVLPPPEKGVWKVKLAITTKQLEEILSEDANTGALIEQMRMAAAAGGGATTPRRSRVSWGLIWKPILGNVLLRAPDDEVLSSVSSCKNSPVNGGVRLKNQRVLNRPIGKDADIESKIIDKLYTKFPESGLR